jgi:hypothetical protein
MIITVGIPCGVPGSADLATCGHGCELEQPRNQPRRVKGKSPAKPAWDPTNSLSEMEERELKLTSCLARLWLEMNPDVQATPHG